ncbi:MAG: 16S rRNA processing protein RimM [Lachnospiraceae bacterium]|jgi:16S rRNA processing protein RimM|nr:16S rRNA processing protein RimM [Lachnospiraceae bacterium]
MNDRLRVGIVGKAQGIKGEVRVHPVSNDASRLLELHNVMLKNKKTETNYEVASARIQKDFCIMRFKGVEDRNTAELLNGTEVLVNREDTAELGDDEFFVGDLIDSQVVTDDGRSLGKLVDVYETGANDVYVVKNGNKELMIPAIKDCIIKVDTENMIITVHLLPGLEDL